MSRNYDIALIGFGNVNRTFADIIHTEGARLAGELGFTMRVTAIADMRMGTLVAPGGIDLGAVLALDRSQTLADVPGGSADCDVEALIRTSPADIVCEATFTNPVDGQPGLSHVRWALESGMSVCTTNKGPAAFASEELEALAAANGVRFEFEGAVMSGTPVLRLASGPLLGVGITGFSGILNGTSNFILDRMESEGLTQEVALREAQRLGYAEADPTADIGGSDVRLKVSVLAKELLGAHLTPDDIPTHGITSITPAMIHDAAAKGARWKLIGRAGRGADGVVTAEVGPQMLDRSHPLAMIGGQTNAVTFETTYLGQVTIAGPGAGRVETAYALLSDIIAIDQYFRAAS